MKLTILTLLTLSALTTLACSSSDSGGDSGAAQDTGTLEVGEVCITTSQCKQGEMEVLCACTPDSSETVCVAQREPGETCASENFAAGCRTGSRCVSRGSDPTCEAYALEGESCAELDCNPGLACRDDICGPGGKAGEACNFFRDSCGEGVHCDFDDDICVPDAEIGEECSRSSDCVAGARCQSSGGPYTCHAVRQLGEECDAFDCADDLRCRSQADGSRRCVEQTTPTQCGGFGY